MSEKENKIRSTAGEVDRLVSAALGDRDIRLAEIPAIDLYIDQILTLVSGKNETASERYRENTLTKTMVNNYSKEGLLLPVKGKKYTAEHIVQMLLIYSLKNTLSIGEIHRVLEGARIEGLDGERLKQSYERYLDEKEKVRGLVAESVAAVNSDGSLESDNGEDFFVALLGLLSYSAYVKNVALELLEARYPLPELTDKVKEKEEKKAEKKAKKNAEREMSDEKGNTKE